MTKRDEYRQKLSELDEMLVSNPTTAEEWQRYRQECDTLKELSMQVLIEEMPAAETNQTRDTAG